MSCIVQLPTQSKLPCGPTLSVSNRAGYLPILAFPLVHVPLKVSASPSTVLSDPPRQVVRVLAPSRPHSSHNLASGPLRPLPTSMTPRSFPHIRLLASFLPSPRRHTLSKTVQRLLEAVDGSMVPTLVVLQSISLDARILMGGHKLPFPFLPLRAPLLRNKRELHSPYRPLPLNEVGAIRSPHPFPAPSLTTTEGFSTQRLSTHWPQSLVAARPHSLFAYPWTLRSDIPCSLSSYSIVALYLLRSQASR